MKKKREISAKEYNLHTKKNYRQFFKILFIIIILSLIPIIQLILIVPLKLLLEFLIYITNDFLKYPIDYLGKLVINETFLYYSPNGLLGWIFFIIYYSIISLIIISFNRKRKAKQQLTKNKSR